MTPDWVKRASTPTAGVAAAAVWVIITRGNYKIVARLFNMEAREYKRFLNFLRKHDCQISFKEYR